MVLHGRHCDLELTWTNAGSNVQDGSAGRVQEVEWGNMNFILALE